MGDDENNCAIRSFNIFYVLLTFIFVIVTKVYLDNTLREISENNYMPKREKSSLEIECTLDIAKIVFET